MSSGMVSSCRNLQARTKTQVRVSHHHTCKSHHHTHTQARTKTQVVPELFRTWKFLMLHSKNAERVGQVLFFLFFSCTHHTCEYVYMRVCIYLDICISGFLYMCMYMCMSVNVVCVRVYIRARTHTCVHARTQVCVYVYTHYMMRDQ